MAVQTTLYPVTYSQDEPESLSRWLWIFKWLLLIPHFVVLWLLSIVASFVLFISWVVILVTGKQPRGLWDFLMGMNRWSARANAYGLHMTDVYPPFTMAELPDYPIRITAEYTGRRSRLTTFFRLLLAIPHMIIVGALGNVLWALVFVNVAIVIFTGKPNSEIYKFMVGILRWQTRSNLYISLITDHYPPFSLE